MKYNSWEEAPIRGKIRILNEAGGINYKKNLIYEYDLTDLIRSSNGSQNIRNITPSFPEGNFIHIIQVEFIDKVIPPSKYLKKIINEI